MTNFSHVYEGLPCHWLLFVRRSDYNIVKWEEWTYSITVQYMTTINCYHSKSPAWRGKKTHNKILNFLKYIKISYFILSIKYHAPYMYTSALWFCTCDETFSRSQKTLHVFAFFSFLFQNNKKISYEGKKYAVPRLCEYSRKHLKRSKNRW